MAEDTQEILEIIDESFLRKEQKELLREQLEKEGPSETFFEAMNKVLTDELGKRSATYEKVVDEFENRYRTVSDEYGAKRRELDAGLDKKLEGIEPADLSTRKQIFDDYYKAVNNAQVSYEKQAKELFSGLSRLIVETAL